MADRVGVIHEGELIVVEDKRTLMKKLGKRVLRIELAQALPALPPALADWPLDLAQGGRRLEYHVGAKGDGDVGALLAALVASGVAVRDVESHETSLEEIFVGLVSGRAAPQAAR
jgi:ABC-2 type transport system ATP-binding protein